MSRACVCVCVCVSCVDLYVCVSCVCASPMAFFGVRFSGALSAGGAVCVRVLSRPGRRAAAAAAPTAAAPVKRSASEREGTRRTWRERKAPPAINAVLSTAADAPLRIGRRKEACVCVCVSACVLCVCACVCV